MISVVVCTYNRADLLANALHTVCEQSLASSEYEIIVVDNNSTDDTRAVAESFCCRYPNVRYCFEGKQGVSRARNRGWKEARGDYVAYVDDDCEVPKQWLAVAKRIIEQQAPTVFGGPYYAFYNSPKPRWWKERYDLDFSRKYRETAGLLPSGKYQDGGNMFIQRSALARIGGFNLDFGPKGQDLAYGEDTLMHIEIREMIPEQRSYYAPELYVNHLVRAEKMSLRWLLRSGFMWGRCSVRWRSRNKVVEQGQFLRAGVLLFMRWVWILIRLVSGLILGMVRVNRTRYPYVQNYLYEHTLGHVKRLGQLYEQAIRFVACLRQQSS
jgi:glycosyltransferase involved in cell wall biosynthesis